MKHPLSVVLFSLAFASATIFAQTNSPPGTTATRNRSLRPACSSQPVVVNVVVFSPPVYDSTAAIYAYEEAQNFRQAGYDWGAGLKANNLVWAEFAPYLQQYVVSASAGAQDAFRQGFIDGFGNSAPATYSRAFRQASRSR